MGDVQRFAAQLERFPRVSPATRITPAPAPPAPATPQRRAAAPLNPALPIVQIDTLPALHGPPIPPTTEQLHDAAVKAQASAVAGAAFAFTGLAALSEGVLRPISPGLADKLTHGTSFESAGAGSRARLQPRIGFRTALFAAAPGPLGYVPPEVYGLPPDYTAKLGIGYLYGVNPKPAQARIDYSRAVRADVAEAEIRAALPSLSVYQLTGLAQNPSARGEVFSADNLNGWFLTLPEVREEEVRALALGELRRRIAAGEAQLNPEDRLTAQLLYGDQAREKLPAQIKALLDNTQQFVASEAPAEGESYVAPTWRADP